MANFLGGGFRIEPEAQSTIEHDYWEEFTRVNSAFTHEPDIAIRKVKQTNKGDKTSKKIKNPISKVDEFNFAVKNKIATVYPRLASVIKSDTIDKSEDSEEPFEEETNIDIDGFRSVAVQTDRFDEADQEVRIYSYACVLYLISEKKSKNYSKKIHAQRFQLPYWFCFCCRSSTPCVVWIFVAISIIFFKMGAIVTGRWIYLSQSSFDEIVFYIAFSVCLG